jgi:predicted DNA-binding transcriptional regulator YafY
MTADERLSRLLRAIVLLQGKTARNIRDLAAELEVSERTVYRARNCWCANPI